MVPSTGMQLRHVPQLMPKPLDGIEDGTFDKALAINSMQVWPDAIGGLREIRRVMKTGGTVALGFTRYSGQPKSGLVEMLTAAGFAEARVVETELGFCARAIKP